MRYCVSLCLFLVTTFLSFGQGPPGQGDSRRPRIVGQVQASIDEEANYTIRLTDLQVRDRDSWFYPWGFTLTVYPGDYYSLNGNIVQPATNFHGTLTVQISVNDGQHESDKFPFKIEVRPVNDPPAITGQNNIVTNEDQAFTLQPGHLIINDPDDTQFNLIISAGNNYTVSDKTITPANNFHGVLSIPVQVNDGEATSPIYVVQLEVLSVNDIPVITGQSNLEMDENESLTLQLTNLTVTDPDNSYPKDFILKILPSSSNTYSVSGMQIKPAQHFEGTLNVPVVVNDGKDDSAPFILKIVVKPVAYPPMITGQQPLSILEDQPILLQLSHLIVTDQDNNYPADFTLKIMAGQNYTANNSIVTPTAHYNGKLTVNVVVNDGTLDSNVFGVIINVTPVNDVPVISNLESEALSYKSTEGPLSISSTIQINDADGDSLISAEIAFKPETYRLGLDELIFENNSRIKGSFDRQRGRLLLSGKASFNEYTNAIRSVKYSFLAGSELPFESKTLIFTVNDSQSTSEKAERRITGEHVIINLDIPTAFTPNGDRSNDTWSIKPLKQSEEIEDVVVRIYSKKGVLLFEAQGFDEEWDGRLNGEFLPADTYFYTIDLNLSSTRTFYKGLVTILR